MDIIPASLTQREQFYKKEFDLERLKEWFMKNSIKFPQLMAVDMGTETGIIKDESKKNKLINIKAVDLRDKFLRYLPEDVYYDRNVYKDPDILLDTLDFKGVWDTDNLLGQQLAFDIDPENMKCSCDGFCDRCMRSAVQNAVALAERLQDNFTRIGLVYSGRGMHVHVFDKEAFSLSVGERDSLNAELKDFAIDPWVSRGYIRLIRLPFSLHGRVSRIVTPLTIKEAVDFDPATDRRILPEFLKD
ncbi:MAG: DNA primase small subunit domain-containing protein [Candidatus Woesearchaeota archaeon]